MSETTKPASGTDAATGKTAGELPEQDLEKVAGGWGGGVGDAPPSTDENHH
jgi:hypothetical protein